LIIDYNKVLSVITSNLVQIDYGLTIIFVQILQTTKFRLFL